ALATSSPILAGGAGCAATTRNVTQGGLEGSLDVMSDKENQQRLNEFATSKESQEAIAAITASVTQGAVQGIRRELMGVPADAGAGGTEAGDAGAGEGAAAPVTGDGETSTQRHGVSGERYASNPTVDRVGQQSQGLLENNIAPGVAAVVGRTVDSTLAAAATEDNVRRTSKLVYAVTQAAVAGLAQGMREELGPALDEMRKNHSSVVAEILADDELRQAVGALAHEISREVILGSEGAIDAINAKRDPNEDGSFLGLFGNGIQRTLTFTLLGLLLTTTAILAAVAIVSRRRRIREEKEFRHREDMLLSLMRVVTSNGSQLSPEQIATIDGIVGGRDPAASGDFVGVRP